MPGDSSAHIGSNDIRVFPSTRRGDTQRSARLVSEQSLTTLVNQLLDRDSFVISEGIVGGEPFAFNIHGYYFRITDGAALLSLISSQLSSPTEVWANITLETTTTTPQDDTFVELKWGDDNNYYLGVGFSAGEGVGDYHLKILEKSGGSYVVPTESTVKFDITRIYGDVAVIDGGEI